MEFYVYRVVVRKTSYHSGIVCGDDKVVAVVAESVSLAHDAAMFVMDEPKYSYEVVNISKELQCVAMSKEASYRLPVS